MKQRIIDNYTQWISVFIYRYSFRNRDKSELSLAEPILARLHARDPLNYTGLLFSATAAFVLRRDIQTATDKIEACRNVDDASWLYSAAFLKAYLGDLDNAYKFYRRAFGATLDDQSVPTQIEEFIQIVIDEEPDRPWLYFCLGLVNLRAKQDLIAARSDLQRFVDFVDPNRFAKHIGICRTWIAEIDAARME